MMPPERFTGRRRRGAPPGFPRSRTSPFSGVGWWGIGAAAVATLSLIAYAAARSPQEVPAPGPATESHANARGGYSFAYPPEWRLREKGTAARVISPRKQASVAFGLGGKGTLRRVAVRFIGQLEAVYRSVSLTGLQLTLLDGQPAVAFTGSAVSRNAVDLRFQAISVAGERRNYSVAVFVAADARPVEVLPPLQAILESFRIEG